MKNDFDKPDRKDKRVNDYASQPAPDDADTGLCVGRNAVRELLLSGRDVDKVFVQRGERDGAIIPIIALAKEKKVPLIETDRAKLDGMCSGARHQGIIAVASQKEYCDIEDILDAAKEKGEAPFIVICDGVEDPHNLGAIIRTAECCGVHGVVIPKRRSAGLTSAVSKASAGAIEYMNVARVTNLAETVEKLKRAGVWIYAADMDGKSYSETDFRGGCAIVLGGEGAGVSRLVKEKCDFIVSIPLYGHVNSLNVSNAGAILMSEAARQRRK